MKSLAIALAISIIAGSATMASATRVAVVDVGTQPVPTAFMDLLLVELTKEPTVALLEREQIVKLMREQVLGLALSGPDAVKAGKLAGVEAFLMLEAGTNQTLRVRLVDARYGLKLWDIMFSVGANAQGFEQNAHALAKGTVFRLANLMCGTDTPRTVSISAFRSEELSKRWDWLGETLGDGIEQQLASQPGIVVMERARTLPLTEERELTEGLPEALRASTVIVDGAYNIDRSRGTNALAVTLRCRRNNVTMLNIVIEGSTTNLEEIQQEVVRRIASSLGSKPDCGSMDPELEAEALTIEAGALLGTDPKRAVSLAEAAAALAPGNDRYEAAPLGAYAVWLGSTSDEYLTYGMRGLDIMERCLRHNGRFTNVMFGFLGNLVFHLNWGQHTETRTALALPENQERFQELADEFWRVAGECRLATKGKDPDAMFSALDRTSDAYRLSPSTTHAIEHSRQTLRDYVDQFKVYNGGLLRSPLERLIGVYFDPSPAIWPLEKDTRKRMTDYLEELSNSDDVLLRMLAERAEIAFYSADEYGSTGKLVDYVQARKHAENYVHAVSVARQRYPRLVELYVEPLKNNKFSDNPQEDAQFQRRMLAMLDPPTKVAPTNVVEFAAHQVLSLENALREAPSSGWHNPDLRFPKERHFRRLVMGTNFAAIVCTQDAIFQEHCSVLQLDPQTLQPRAYTLSNVEIPFKPYSGNVQMDYTCFGPSVAERDGDIFAGFPMGGIVCFRKDGTSTVRNEANGLATDDIRDLDALDDKLYAVVGRMFGESGLMEFNPKSGVSKIVCSTKSKFHRNELDGTQICGLAADNNQHILWVLTPQGLFTYRPANQSINNRTDIAATILKTLQLPEILMLQRQGENLLVSGDRVCFKMNMRTEQVDILATSIYYPFGNVDSRWKIRTEKPRRIVELDHGLTFMDEGNGTERSAMLYLDGRTAAVDLLNACFPSEVAAKLTLRDMAPTNDGLLLLTDDALWLIPELRSKQ